MEEQQLANPPCNGTEALNLSPETSTPNKYSPYSSPEGTSSTFVWATSTTSNAVINGHDSLHSNSPSLEDDIQRWQDIHTTPDGEVTYKCEECGFQSASKFHYNSHLNTHAEHKCSFCDYTSRTEGRLKRHVREFHVGLDSSKCSEKESEDGDSGLASSNSSKKARNYRCKQCDFVAVSKADFWQHNRTHIKEEKLLTCPNCPFVTEYKHHLEYHLRNHAGSKPFKCNKCNYTCVNKSMLNSHMKSHSNIYQYHCASCSYATKYCHSLKLHLRKYKHTTANVLNPDGTPAESTVDVYGNRRGTKKKKKSGSNQEENGNGEIISQSNSNSHTELLVPSVGYYSFPTIPSSQVCLPFTNNMNGLANSHCLNRTGVDSSQTTEVERFLKPTISIQPYKCNLCEFSSDYKDAFNRHMVFHATRENEDLCRIYGINPETLFLYESNHPLYSLYTKNGYLSAPADREKLNTDYSTPNGTRPNSPEEYKLSFNSLPSPKDFVSEEEKTVPTTTENIENSENHTNGNVDSSLPLDLSNCKTSPKNNKADSSQEFSRNRRKGKAFKIERIYMKIDHEDNKDDHEEENLNMSNLQTHKTNGQYTRSNEEKQNSGPDKNDGKLNSYFNCIHCDLLFKDCAMYSIHMGYHDYNHPFKCNVCGIRFNDKLSFFIHIARVAHD
ncbi:protein hunchback-like [Centruroides sculpturatus]|uniref:protein hunchback-like n=1 Tax=Centruroides sculpturatus TaxID=218467 RepID=UPI000C6E4066|nr:protein hunchback-like [Centruroides sculpturatus]XP_023215615.1 protein hunchback-like [Centruroides sculpturatus]XP_023215616.1 protein hunchback-like [Centruroides sculpturatus]XP_023215617.1 protein hunchback-like [Centruroides sculpturatus]XP_023215618.1 protein hunchback-like [Centruroides sculpturatus]XP_023215619.1 protein hunchback-like [Centruroides sculpturatus]XP_023215620.1 protein hunchback-like [Centruroides sculpturatus]XP_023215621.1 protein hunchback-like [Centruroides s